MEPLYKPAGVEERWQKTWEEEGLYNADPDLSRPAFVDAHPPPNVTGELHIGHALQLALGDSIVRMKRMQGFNVLFQPGYDHAGISTQNAVEKYLATKGKTRQELGREAFEARVWEWLHEYGGKIMNQFRRIGASLDYRRERFTMDEGYTKAVLRFFVHLYRKGWIYRDNRIINWCPFHRTSLSDLELVHVDADDELVTVRYPLAEGDGYVAIATVRPATIPADVALAVHPGDERYQDLVGKEVIVPFVERRIPVIADEHVDPEFGTGALKITPAHDPVDFEIGRAHGLGEPSVIGPDGRMNDEVPGLAGLTQDEATERILAWCEERDLLVSREPFRHAVALCERCETRIEPRVSLQWWCSMEELKKPALAALREKRGVYYTPEPVVGYIVRSVDELLKEHFNKPKGLADEQTLILDPATATATFIYLIIQRIHAGMAGQLGAWPGYVADHLLKRVFGFELLMAPYAIAHLKLGRLLQDTGFHFQTDQRLGIYLTNTLEEAVKHSDTMFAQWISEEANAAADIKKTKPIMVVLGNPPYSVSSSNKGVHIEELMDSYKKAVRSERNIQPLSDDYRLKHT